MSTDKASPSSASLTSSGFRLGYLPSNGQNATRLRQPDWAIDADGQAGTDDLTLPLVSSSWPAGRRRMAPRPGTLGTAEPLRQVPAVQNKGDRWDRGWCGGNRAAASRALGAAIAFQARTALQARKAARRLKARVKGLTRAYLPSRALPGSIPASARLPHLRNRGGRATESSGTASVWVRQRK